MARTLAAHYADVHRALGSPPDTAITKDQIIRAINDSYFECARLFRHENLIQTDTGTTIADQATYALPSGFWFSIYLKDTTNDQEITNKDLQWMLQQDISGDNIETGEPLYWAREARGHFRLYPVPDDAYNYKFWYYQRPNVLDDMVEQDALEDEWNEILKLGAIQRGFFILGEYDRQVQALNLQRHLLNNMVEFEQLDDEFGLDIAGPLEDIDERSS